MINIAEKLENCPKGFKLYSPLFGEVLLEDIYDDRIYVLTPNKHTSSFDCFGKFFNYLNSECLLFPSKEQRDWNKFKFIEKGHRVICSDNEINWVLREYVKNDICNMIDKKEITYKWKYPALKCDNEELWEEIKKVLESFGITEFHTWYFNNKSYIVSNYGNSYNDKLKIGSTVYNNEKEINEHYRYLVNTKEEFLSAIAKLLNTKYMEERSIKVTLEKAKEWYNSNDNTLKELALQAFKEDELLDFESITLNYPILKTKVPVTQINKWKALHKLNLIANYLNGNWNPNWNDNNEKKYYIYKDDSEIHVDCIRICNINPIVFKTKELAEKAIKLMGEEINYIFE